MTEHLRILESLHKQVELLGLGREPMSPVERHLANAILVTLNVLIDERRGAEKK